MDTGIKKVCKICSRSCKLLYNDKDIYQLRIHCDCGYTGPKSRFTVSLEDRERWKKFIEDRIANDPLRN